MWECEDTNKYLEYMNLRIWGRKDARIQARTHEPKDMRMRGYKQLHRCKIHVSISISTIYISVYMIYISNDTMQSTFIFWCTIHETLPLGGFLQKAAIKNFSIFRKAPCFEVSFLIKLQAWLWNRCFLVNFAKILRTSFTEYLWINASVSRQFFNIYATRSYSQGFCMMWIKQIIIDNSY